MQLPLLVVLYAGVSGIITLNNHIAGEITPQSIRISLPLPPQGNVYLGFYPFECDKLPFIRRLWADGEGLKLEQDPCLLVTSWPGGIYALEPYPVTISRRDPGTVPQAVARCSQDHLTATLYKENDYFLVVEDREEDKILLFYGLKTNPGKCDMSFVINKGVQYIIVNGEQCALLADVGESRVLLEQKAATIHLDQEEIICIKKINDFVGHYEKTLPMEEGNSPEYGFCMTPPNWPQTKEETAIAFMEAIHLNLYDEARNYLSRELGEDMDDETIGDFFKDHSQWIRPLYHPQNTTCLGGINMDTRQVKIFSFYMIEEENEQGPLKIDNIREE